MNSGENDSDLSSSLDTHLPMGHPRYAAIQKNSDSAMDDAQTIVVPQAAESNDFFDTDTQFTTNLGESVEDDAKVSRGPLPKIPGYEILEVIGRGGMGVVYKAIDVRLGREVAIKMMAISHQSPDAMMRFETEARSLAQVAHPGVVRLFEVGQVDGTPFIAMELIRGQGLDRVAAGQPLQPRKAAEFARQLAETLQACHDQGIVHRDIKPSNAIIGPNGELKLTDFGLARRMDVEAKRLTRTGDIMGTPAYMSPEQASGVVQNIGPLTDIYSAGAVLYELLTGRPPFSSPEVLQTVMLVMTAPPVPPRTLQPRIPKDLENITLKCLQKNPSHRYRSSKELLDDLNRYLRGEPVLAKPAPMVRRIRLWIARHPAWTSIGVLCGIGLVGLIGGISFHNSRLQTDLERQKRLVDEGRELSNWLLDDFSRELGGDAGITMLRSRLAARTKSYLDHVRKEASTDVKLRTTLAESLVRLAALQGQPQVGSLGQTAAARASLMDALEILGQETASESNVATAVRMLAHLRLADLDLQESNGEPTGEQLSAVRSTFDRIVDRIPREHRTSIELELLTLEVLLATQKGQSSSVNQSVTRISEIVEERLKEENDPEKMAAILSTYWRARAGWMQQQDLVQEIIAPLENDLERIAQSLDGKAPNLNTRAALASMKCLLADAQARSGDPDLAMENYQSNRDTWQMLLDRDSQNQGALFNLAHAWQSIGEMASRTQDLELAGKAIGFAKEHYVEYTKRTGKDFNTYPETLYLLGSFADWHRRMGQLDEARDEAKLSAQQFSDLGRSDVRYRQAAGDALLQLGMIESEAYSNEINFTGDTPPQSLLQAFERVTVSLTEAIDHFEKMKTENILTTQGEGQLKRARIILEYLRRQHQVILDSVSKSVGAS